MSDWIPVTERLPGTFCWCWITFIRKNCDPIDDTPYSFFIFFDGDVWQDIIIGEHRYGVKNMDIIAWKPMIFPESYQPPKKPIYPPPDIKR